jgi:cyanophycin synthetase
MTVQDDQFASFKLLDIVLQAKGYHMSVDTDEPLVVTYKNPAGKSWTTRASHITYPFNSEYVRDISINKQKAYDFAAQHGFSIPYSKTVETELADSEGLELLATYGKLIVKPSDSSLGRGLTLNITTLPELKEAIKKAQEVSRTVLVQQQVEGEELRFVVVGGKVEAVLLRQTARVVGDGSSTIAELIAAENDLRREIKLERIEYPLLSEALVDKAVLTSSRVPVSGEIVELNRSTMVRGGASIYNMFSEVHKTYIDKVEALTQKLGAGFIVADVFCRDYKQPADDQNYWLIEFNTAPVLKLCYACRDGRQFDVVTRLADQIDLFL